MFEIKDNKVYYNGEHVPSVKTGAFMSLSDHIGKDNRKVYWGVKIVKGADARTFELFSDDHFYRDKKRVYYLGQEIPGADPATFKVFYVNRDLPQFSYYAKDRHGAYYIDSFRTLRVKRIYTRSIDAFEGLDDQYAIDKEYVYGRGIKRENSAPRSLEELGHGYWKDKNNVYYDGKVLEGADAGSFLVIGGNMYATDIYNYFWNGNLWNSFKDKISSDEVKEFINTHKDLKKYWWNQDDLASMREYGRQFEGQEGYFIQDNKVYWEGSLLKHADYRTLVILNAYYAKDDKYAYYTDKKLIKSEASLFKLVEDPYDKAHIDHGSYASDDVHFYFKGKIEKKISPSSYKFLNRYYSKDDNNVYYQAVRLIRGADAASFSVIEDKYAEDDFRYYREGVRESNKKKSKSEKKVAGVKSAKKKTVKKKVTKKPDNINVTDVEQKQVKNKD